MIKNQFDDTITSRISEDEVTYILTVNGNEEYCGKSLQMAKKKCSLFHDERLRWSEEEPNKFVPLTDDLLCALGFKKLGDKLYHWSYLGGDEDFPEFTMTLQPMYVHQAVDMIVWHLWEHSREKGKNDFITELRGLLRLE